MVWWGWLLAAVGWAVVAAGLCVFVHACVVAGALTDEQLAEDAAARVIAEVTEVLAFEAAAR